MEKNYKAFIHKGDTVGYGITFPDFPGCVSDGVNLDYVINNGKEALQLYVDAVYEAGGNVPAPGDIDEAWLKDECDDIECIAIVPVEIPVKNIRLNVSMSDFVVNQVDSFAKSHGMTRSGVLTKAALRYVAG